MKVLSDILHKAGILKDNAEGYSSGGYSVLVRNSTTQRLETVSSSVFTNIYNSNGTLSGNRSVTLGGNNLDIVGSTTTRFASNGNVIIGGTTDAGFKLDVNGTAKINGDLTIGSIGNLVTTNQFYGRATNFTNGIFVGWDSFATYLGYQMGATPVHIGTGGTGEVLFRNTGGLKVESFAGVGSRMVVTDSTGALSTQVLPTSTNIYNSDGTLTGNRTVTQSGNYLNFVGGRVSVYGSAGNEGLFEINSSISNGNASLSFYENPDGTSRQYGSIIRFVGSDNTLRFISKDVTEGEYHRQSFSLSTFKSSLGVGSLHTFGSAIQGVFDVYGTPAANGILGYLRRSGAGDVMLGFSQWGGGAGYAIGSISGGGFGFYNDRWTGGAGTEVARFSTSNNFLIGTASDTGLYKLDVQGTGRFTGMITGRATMSNTQTSTDYAIQLNGISTTDATTRQLISLGSLGSTGILYGAIGITANLTDNSVGTWIFANGANTIGHGVVADSGTATVDAFMARTNGQGTGGSIGYAWRVGNSTHYNFNVYNDGTYYNLRLFNRTGIISYIRDRDTTNITFGSNTYYASAQVAIDSTTKGFLPPRMTGAQVEAISSPAEGLLAYATNAGSGAVTSSGWWGYNGTTWVKLN
jgi:hypothetical protein